MMPRIGADGTSWSRAHLPNRRRGKHSKGMPATTTHWTVEMRNALPDDGQRYEVIDGELFVTPAPRWAHPEAVGHVILSPADVEFARDTVVEPDLFVVPLVD